MPGRRPRAEETTPTLGWVASLLHTVCSLDHEGSEGTTVGGCGSRTALSFSMPGLKKKLFLDCFARPSASTGILVVFACWILVSCKVVRIGAFDSGALLT